MRVAILIASLLALAAVASASADHWERAGVATQQLYDKLHGLVTDAAVSVPQQCQAQLEAAGQRLQNQGQCLNQQPQFGPGKTLTQDQLDQVCGPSSCLRIVFPVFRELIDCIANNGDPTQADLIRNLFSTVFSVFDFICTRDDAGAYCALAWQDPRFPNSVANLNPEGCAFLVSTGCCARTFLKYLVTISSGFGGLSGTPSAGQIAVNATVRYCGLTDGPACPAPGVVRKTIAVNWVLNNFNCTWLAGVPPATARLLFFYLARDISRFLGVRVGAVAVAKLTGCSRTVTPQSIEHHLDLSSVVLQATTTAPISVSFNVRGDTDAQTNALLATVTAQSASSSLAFTDTTTAIPAVGALSNNPSAATVTTAQVGTSLSPASRAVVQSLTLLAAALLAIFVGKQM